MPEECACRAQQEELPLRQAMLGLEGIQSLIMQAQGYETLDGLSQTSIKVCTLALAVCTSCCCSGCKLVLRRW